MEVKYFFNFQEYIMSSSAYSFSVKCGLVFALLFTFQLPSSAATRCTHLVGDTARIEPETFTDTIGTYSSPAIESRLSLGLTGGDKVVILKSYSENGFIRVRTFGMDTFYVKEEYVGYNHLVFSPPYLSKNKGIYMMRLVEILKRKRLGLCSYREWNHAGCLFGIAMCCLDGDEYQEALPYLTESIDLQPHGEKFYYRGKIKSELRDYRGAIMDFDIAESLFEGFIAPMDQWMLTKLYWNRGGCYHELGEYQEAISEYKKYPIEDVEVEKLMSWNFGICYLRLSDTTSACKYFRRSSDLGDADALGQVRRFCN
ncbi:tetratricopeptide repeat protein [Salibacteraceae bacterium]|jgi:hypothetical protein|nr:tetratricopeptide repeat protein [Salibacteraceae bacterium]